MSKLVMIDSNIFIWGVKGQSSSSQEDLIPQAKLFIQHLTNMKYRILMPIPQMGELLSPVPVDEQDKIRKLIDSRFWVVPFDDLAVSKFSELVYKSLTEPELKQYRADHKVSKNKLKFDCMLVAIAITRGATKIYSNDSDLKKFAQGQIHVEAMPYMAVQQEMYLKTLNTEPGPK